MRLLKRIPNLWFYSIVVLFAIFEGILLVYSLETGRNKTRNIVVLLPFIVLMFSLLQRIRIATLIGFLLLIFWIPAGFDNWMLYTFEILLYVITLIVMLISTRSNALQQNNALTNIPWFGFLLFAVGAIITWLLSTKTGNELNEIRTTSLIPMALSIVFFLTIRSIKDAEHYLIIILTSAGILGLLFLVGKNFSGLITLSEYATESGRLSMSLIIPFVGSMTMLPQSTSNWFGYLLIFSFSVWILHPSRGYRIFGLLLCLLYGAVIISTSGRGGLITAVLGAAVISVYTGFSRSGFRVKGVWLKLGLVCFAVLGGFWYLSTSSSNLSFYQHGISLFKDPLNDPTLLYRFRMWSNGWNLYMENPFFGVGLSGIATPWGPDTSEILNYFFYILLSYGLMGFIGLILILVKLSISYLQGMRADNRIVRMMSVAGIGGFLGFLLGMQPEEPYSITLVYAPLLVAFAVSRLYKGNLLLDPTQVDIQSKYSED